MTDTDTTPEAEQDTQQTRRKFLTAATSAVGAAGVVGRGSTVHGVVEPL